MPNIRKEKAKIKFGLRPAAGKPFDVVAFGENSLDFMAIVEAWPRLDSKERLRQFAMRPGGQAATVAVGCARLGLRARYVGSLGDDGFADLVLANLASESVDALTVRKPDTPTRTALVLVDGPTGKRTVLENRDSRLGVTAADFPGHIFSSGRVLVVDATDLPAATRAAQEARRAGVPTIVDVDHVADGVDELLRSIDVIIVSSDFPRSFTGAAGVGEALAKLEARFRPAAVVATLGPDGALARCSGKEVHTPALAVDAVDTTGAGDAFRAGFVAGWLRQDDRLDFAGILAYAHIVAGLNCRALGAQTTLPTAAEMSRFPV